MGKFIALNPETLKELRKIDSRLVSYNVEMTEVTGGTFWKAYTPEQVDGIEEFPVISDWRNMAKLQQYYEPINLYHPRLLKMAIVRVFIRQMNRGILSRQNYYLITAGTMVCRLQPQNLRMNQIC